MQNFDQCLGCLDYQFEFSCDADIVIPIITQVGTINIVVSDNIGNMVSDSFQSVGESITLPSGPDGFYQIGKTYYIYLNDDGGDHITFSYQDKSYDCLWVDLFEQEQSTCLDDEIDTYLPCQECLELDVEFNCGGAYDLPLSGLPQVVFDFYVTDNNGIQLSGLVGSDGNTVQIPADNSGFYQVDKKYYLYFKDANLDPMVFTYNGLDYTCLWMNLKPSEVLTCYIDTESNDHLITESNDFLITETVC